MARAARTEPTQETDGAPSDARLHVLLGYLIRRASVAIQADLAETLRPFDLRMITYTALVLVDDNPGLNQAQLARLMDVERPNLVAIIDELARRGLVIRDRAPEDRRAYALNPSAEGSALCLRATQAVNQHEARIFDGLAKEDRRIVQRAMARIRHNAGGDAEC